MPETTKSASDGSQIYPVIWHTRIFKCDRHEGIVMHAFFEYLRFRSIFISNGNDEWQQKMHSKTFRGFKVRESERLTAK